jgi:hypothetical protein
MRTTREELVAAKGAAVEAWRAQTGKVRAAEGGEFEQYEQEIAIMYSLNLEMVAAMKALSDFDDAS